MNATEVGFDGSFEMFSYGGKKTIKLAHSNDLNFIESKNWNFQLNNTFLWINKELLYRNKSGELFRVSFDPI